MNYRLLGAYCAVQARRQRVRDRVMRDESGEGVISVAIVVLIMAFLGALMWVGFNQIWQGADANIRGQVDSIGG